MTLIFCFFVVSHFVPKLRKFKKIGARNTHLIDGTLLRYRFATEGRVPSEEKVLIPPIFSKLHNLGTKIDSPIEHDINPLPPSDAVQKQKK